MGAEGAAGPRAKNAMPDKNPEPGLTYGSPAELPMPKTVVFTASPDQILEEAEGLDSRRRQTRSSSTPLSANGRTTSGRPTASRGPIGESDEMLQKTRRANELCRALDADTFH